jgi:hypothetical protein
MPMCRNSHTAVGSASRLQCEMPQISMQKIERQVRFLAARESRRERRKCFQCETDDRCFLSFAIRGIFDLLTNHLSAHVVPQFAQWPRDKSSNRPAIEPADWRDVGPGRSLDTNFRNCRAGYRSGI